MAEFGRHLTDWCCRHVDRIPCQVEFVCSGISSSLLCFLPPPAVIMSLQRQTHYQIRCPHIQLTSNGSNRAQTRVTCTQCGKVILLLYHTVPQYFLDKALNQRQCWLRGEARPQRLESSRTAALRITRSASPTVRCPAHQAGTSPEGLPAGFCLSHSNSSASQAASDIALAHHQAGTPLTRSHQSPPRGRPPNLDESENQTPASKLEGLQSQAAKLSGAKTISVILHLNQ